MYTGSSSLIAIAAFSFLTVFCITGLKQLFDRPVPAANAFEAFFAANYTSLWFTIWLVVFGYLFRWFCTAFRSDQLEELYSVIDEAGVCFEMAFGAWDTMDRDMYQWLDHYLEERRNLS